MLLQQTPAVPPVVKVVTKRMNQKVNHPRIQRNVKDITIMIPIPVVIVPLHVITMVIHVVVHHRSLPDSSLSIIKYMIY